MGIVITWDMRFRDFGFSFVSFRENTSKNIFCYEKITENYSSFLFKLLFSRFQIKMFCKKELGMRRKHYVAGIFCGEQFCDETFLKGNVL